MIVAIIVKMYIIGVFKVATEKRLMIQ